MIRKTMNGQVVEIEAVGKGADTYLWVGADGHCIATFGDKELKPFLLKALYRIEPGKWVTHD